jgi:ubiquinone/menaquinone biosynthesis C-methylase UbiE
MEGPSSLSANRSSAEITLNDVPVREAREFSRRLRFPKPSPSNPRVSDTLPLMQPDEEIINRWTNSAPFWQKNHKIIRQMFAPVAQALISDAQISKGQKVLDVATGPGEPALSLADIVGPDGRVLGVDPIPEMIAGARRAADRLGLNNATFEVASADQLPFPDSTFDAVISRFGIMFFPSPADGIREMLRVLTPGRKLALAVWCSADRNPFHYELSRIIDRYVESPAVDPDAPDAFRFADSGKLLTILSEVGVVAPAERVLQFKIEAPISSEEFWTLRCEMSEAFRGKLASLSDQVRAEIRRQALEAFREYSSERGMSFPAEVLILSGSKPPAA